MGEQEREREKEEISLDVCECVRANVYRASSSRRSQEENSPLSRPAAAATAKNGNDNDTLALAGSLSFMCFWRFLPHFFARRSDTISLVHTLGSDNFFIPQPQQHTAVLWLFACHFYCGLRWKIL